MATSVVQMLSCLSIRKPCGRSNSPSPNPRIKFPSASNSITGFGPRWRTKMLPLELARFRAWFEAFDAQQFDGAIERDTRAGKLDAHAEEALTAHPGGHSREL